MLEHTTRVRSDDRQPGNYYLAKNSEQASLAWKDQCLPAHCLRHSISPHLDKILSPTLPIISWISLHLSQRKFLKSARARQDGRRFETRLTLSSPPTSFR